MLREDRDIVLVDVRAATQQLEQSLRIAPSGGGPIANLRGGSFELDVQRMLDASPWAPSQQLAALRRRTLRLDGETITDLDAVGGRRERRGRRRRAGRSLLLLVSAKSYPYSDEYDAGEHRAVRNVAEKVVRAVKDWQEKVQKLRNHPRGDNYDFSGYDELIGLVCTPFAAYVPLGLATAEVQPGLRAAVSYGELAEWVGVRDKGQ